MSPLGLSLSLLIGVSLGFFGGGGSILTVPLLLYVFGFEPKQAIASSLVIVGIASLAGTLQHWRAGNLRPKEGLVFGGAGMAGAYLGGRVGALVDGGLLVLLFAAMMLLTAGAMWRGRRAPGRAPADPHATRKLLMQGGAVGSFTGLVGAGGGFLIVPALALWAGLPMPAAVGTSLFVIVLNCAAGSLGYLSHVDLDWPVVATVASCAVGGSFVGARLARVVEPASLRRAFAGFILVMSVAIFVREGALLASTTSAALPASVPQLIFAVAMLGVGVVAGRVSRGAERKMQDLHFAEGGGI